MEARGGRAGVARGGEGARGEGKGFVGLSTGLGFRGSSYLFL